MEATELHVLLCSLFSKHRKDNLSLFSYSPACIGSIGSIHVHSMAAIWEALHLQVSNNVCVAIDSYQEPLCLECLAVGLTGASRLEVL